VLVVSFKAQAIRKDVAQGDAALAADLPGEPSAALTGSRAPVLVPPFPTLSDRPSPAAVALGTSVALVGTYLLVRLGYGLLTGKRG